MVNVAIKLERMRLLGADTGKVLRTMPVVLNRASFALNGTEVMDGGMHWLPRTVQNRSRKWSLWNSVASLALAALVGMVVYGVLAGDLMGLRQEVEVLRRQATLASATEAETDQAVRQQREQVESLSSELATVGEAVGELRREAIEARNHQITLATLTQAAQQQQREQTEGLAHDLTALRQEVETLGRHAMLASATEAEILQAAQQQRERAGGLARDLAALSQEVELLKSSRETAHETSSQPSLVGTPVPLLPSPLASEKADSAIVIGAQPKSESVGASVRPSHPAIEPPRTGSITAAAAHPVTEADQRRKGLKLSRADAAQSKAQEVRQRKRVNKMAARRADAGICNGCFGRAGRVGGSEPIPPTIEGPDGMPMRPEDFKKDWSY